MRTPGKLTLETMQLARLILSGRPLAMAAINPQQVEERVQDIAITKVREAIEWGWENSSSSWTGRAA